MPLTPPPRRERDNNTALNYTGLDSVPTCNCIIIINDIGSLTGLNAPERYPIERCLYLLTANLYPRVSSRLLSSSFSPDLPLLCVYICVCVCVCSKWRLSTSLIPEETKADERAMVVVSFRFVPVRGERERSVAYGRPAGRAENFHQNSDVRVNRISSRREFRTIENSRDFISRHRHMSN